MAKAKASLATSLGMSNGSKQRGGRQQRAVRKAGCPAEGTDLLVDNTHKHTLGVNIRAHLSSVRAANLTVFSHQPQSNDTLHTWLSLTCTQVWAYLQQSVRRCVCSNAEH